MIIDAHHHFWKYNDAEFGWIEQASIRRDFLPEHLSASLDAAGVGGTVLVQARESLEETGWNLELASSCEWIQGVVGWVDWTRPDALETLVPMAGREWLKGLRLGIQGKDAGMLENPVVAANVRALRTRGLACDLLLTADQLEAATAFASRHPEQRFIIDHCAKPVIGSREFDMGWANRITELSRLPNVHCKMSGLVSEVRDSHWSKDLLHNYWSHALNCFGYERLLFGSDWPVCLGRVGYVEWVQMVRTWTEELTEPEAARVLGGNARAFYKLED